jgi:myosin V
MRTLRSTTPHYIKCIKPNSAKAPLQMEAPIVLEQLRYSGVLEVVRIRREGYTIRLSFIEFYRNYETLFLAAKREIEHGSIPPATSSHQRERLLSLLGSIPAQASKRGHAQRCTAHHSADEATARDCCTAIAEHFLDPGTFQIGKTLLFLRESCFDRLQVALRRVLHCKAAKIQAVVRAFQGSTRFKRAVKQCTRLQASMR